MKYRFLIILTIFLGLFISFRDYKVDFKLSHTPTAESKYIAPPVDFDDLPRDKRCCRHVITMHSGNKSTNKEVRKIVIKHRTSQPHQQRSGVFYTWLSSVLDINPLDQTIFSVSLRVGT